MGNDVRAEKARAMRYKKPIAKGMNLEDIHQGLYDMMEACEEVHWYDGDMEGLVEALDGDEDEAYEFRMAFTSLEAELEQFQADLEQEWVSKWFDTLFPAVGYDGGGLMGYDEYEGDYYGLDAYQYAYAHDEAAKRIMTLTKKDLLSAVGSCLKVYTQYVSVSYRYASLDAAIETLRGDNMERLKLVKGIEEQYELAEEDTMGFKNNFGEELRKLDRMLQNVPQEYWAQ